MKIEIKNRWSDAVIYTHEAEGATMRDAVMAAVRQGVSLRDANLRAADLRAADSLVTDRMQSNRKGEEIMNVKPTPTPWYANLQDDGFFDIQDSPNANVANVLCTRFEWPERKEEMHANAAFIVRAVNSHEQLLDVVKEMMQLGDRLVDDIYGYEFVQKAKAALAAAEAP